MPMNNKYLFAEKYFANQEIEKGEACKFQNSPRTMIFIGVRVNCFFSCSAVLDFLWKISQLSPMHVNKHETKGFLRCRSKAKFE